MIHFTRYQLPLLLWLVLIFTLSAIPNVPSVKFPISPDKVAHTGIYFILCMFSRRAFFHQERWPWLKEHASLSALLFTVTYGILDEIHQIYVPNRTADIYDAMADTLGAALFLGWIWYYGRRKKNKTSA